MSTKSKALVLCLLVAAFGSLSGTAGGETGGHLVYEVAKGNWKAEEDPEVHRLEFKVGTLGTEIVCPEGLYQTPFTQNTETDLALDFFAEEKCKTTGGVAGEVPIDFNTCRITLKVSKKTNEDNTTSINCEFLAKKKYIEITHPNCTVRLPEQIIRGVSFSQFVESGKHILTITLTEVGGNLLTAHFEGGICLFLGTTHTASITGALTFRAYDEAGKLTGVTATGG